MKKINLPLLLALVVGSVLLVVGIYVLHRFQVSRNADNLLRRAEQYRAEGESEKAFLEMHRYLSLRPRDTSQRIAYARDLASVAEKIFSDRQPRPGEFRQYEELAFLAYEQAVREQPENRALRRELIDHAMRYGRFPAAREHIQVLLRDEESQDRADLEVLLARCQVQMGDTAEAKASLCALIGYDESRGQFEEEDESAPARDHVDAYVLLAAIYREQSLENDHADRVMRRLVEVNPESHRAHLEQARYLLRWDDTAEGVAAATEAAAAALRKAPGDEETIVVAAEAALKKNDFARATELLEAGLQQNPRSDRIYFSLSTVALRQNDPQRAMEYIERGLEAAGDSIGLLWRKASLQVAQRDVAGVRATMERFRSMGARPHLIEYFDARLLLLGGKWIEAAHKLERLRPLMAETPELAVEIDKYLGECYARLSQPDKELEAYRRVLSVQPNDLVALQGEARALRGLGRGAEADEVLKRIERMISQAELKPSPEFRERMFLVRLAEQAGRPEAQRDWSQLDAEMASILADEEFPDLTRILLRTELLVRKGQEDEARRYVVESLRKYPDELRLWIRAADLAQRQGGPDAALRILDRLPPSLADDVNVRLIRGNLMVQLKGADAKSDLARLEQDSEQFSVEQRVTLWLGLAEMRARIGDVADAQRLLERAADEQKDNPQLRLQLFDLSLRIGDELGMNAALAEIARLFGHDSAEWKFCEARRVLWQMQMGSADESALDRAWKLVEEARAVRPDWQNLTELAGQIRLLQGDTEEGVKLLERSLELGPASPLIVNQLVQLLIGEGRYQQAQFTLSRLDERQLANLNPRIRALLQIQHGDDINAVIDSLREEIDPDSGDPQDQLWYGRLLAAAGRDAEAERYLRRAVELGPQVSDAWLALIQLLIATQRETDAELEIRRAQLALPGHEVPLVLAQSYEMLRDLRQAEHYYRMALEARPDDLNLLRRMAGFYLNTNRPDAARSHLDRMLAGAQPNAPTIDPNVAWARRALARLLASTFSYQNYLEAQQLLDANVPAGGRMSPEDLLLSVTLAAERPDPLSRQRAIQLLESTQEERQLTDEERHVLARLYNRAGRWGECQSIMTTLLARNPDDPFLITSYCEMLLGNQRAGEVAAWLRRLEPNSEAAIRIRAQMLVQQGQSDEAVRLLLSLIPDPLPPEQTPLLRNIAQLLEQLQLYDVAERLLIAYVQREPQQALLLAAFHARRGNVSEALRLCDEFRGRQPIFALTQVGVDALMRADPASRDPQHVQKVRSWFEEGLREFPDSKNLLLQLALFEDMLGNTDEVVRIYRSYLTRPDTDRRQQAIVENNLAFVLALQGEGEESLQLINRAIEELGPTPDLLDTRAVVYLARREPGRAIVDLEQALTVEDASPDSAAKYFHLAQAYHMARDLEPARRALEQAKALGLTEQALPPVQRPLLPQLMAALGVEP